MLFTVQIVTNMVENNMFAINLIYVPADANFACMQAMAVLLQNSPDVRHFHVLSHMGTVFPTHIGLGEGTYFPKWVKILEGDLLRVPIPDPPTSEEGSSEV